MVLPSPPGAPEQQPQPGPPQFVLLEKATPTRIMNPQNVVSDTKAQPLPTRGFNSAIVDVAPGPGSIATSVTLLGAPTAGGPWLQEVDPNAFQSGLAETGPHRFVVTGISAWVAISLTQAVGWTVWITLYNAAAQTNISVIGTSSTNLAQIGGTPLSAGHQPMAASIPVVVASDQTPFATLAQGALTNRSGAIAVGGAAQQLAPANGNRKYLLVENPSTAAGQGIAAVESLWLNFTANAVIGSPSIELGPGGSLLMESSFVSTELVSVIAATTGHAFVAKEA